MPNALKIIAEICDAAKANGFSHSPRVVDQKGFDLSKFTAQKSDISGVKTEHVYQTGPGIGGDDFEYIVAYPIGDKFFVISGST